MAEINRELFMSKILPEPNSGCWLWAAGDNGYGYGVFHIKRKNWAAHRISWQIHNGSIPDGLCVLHKCDVPACVNPDHLFLGTQADNMNDMTKKGRRQMPPTAAGVENGNVKLTEMQVRVIHRLAANKAMTQPEIASYFGVVRGTVAKIKGGFSWQQTTKVGHD